MPTPQRVTADALVAAYNRMDNDAIIAFRAPTCLRYIHPASLNFPPQDNAGYKRNLDSMQSVFANFSLKVTDVVEDAAARKICMWLEARGDTLAGEYVNEYVWNIEFDEAGKKIVGWREFVDVGMAKDFFPKLMAEVKRKRAEEA